VTAEQHEEQAGLHGEGGEPALQPWFAVAGGDDRVGQPGGGGSRPGRPLRPRRGGERDGGGGTHAPRERGGNSPPAPHFGRLLRLAAHFCYTAVQRQVLRRPARCQCAEPAMASAAALPRLPSRRSTTCPVPQIRVLPVVSRAEAAVGVPSRVT